MRKKIMCMLFALLMFAQIQGDTIHWGSTPAVLSGANNAVDAQISIDGSGNAEAVWTENNFVKSSSKPVSGSWSSAVNLSASGGSSGRVVSDSSGNATAIWLEGGVVKASTKLSGGSWSASTALSTGTGAVTPTLCVDSAGDVVAAWVRSSNIESSTKLFGASWQAKVLIASNSPSIPVIAIGGSGSNTRAVLVWKGVTGGFSVTYSSTKLISGSWSSQTIISDSTHNADQPYVAVDAAGNACAVWYSFDTIGNSSKVCVKTASRSIVTGTWSTISALSKPGVRNTSGLTARVAFDAAGNAVALWNTSFDDETFFVQSATKPVNGKWCKSVDLVQSNLFAYTTELAATSYGDVVGLYSFYNGSDISIESVEADVSGFANNIWTVPAIISTGSNNAFPKVAISVNGNTVYAAAIWLNYDGTNTKAVGLTGSKTLILPPTSLSVSQSSTNFGVFTEYKNTLSWTASTDPSVVGYNIFRNGQFITQVDSSVTQFIDDNRANGGTVKYGVAAINSDGAQSAVVTVTYP